MANSERLVAVSSPGAPGTGLRVEFGSGAGGGRMFTALRARGPDVERPALGAEGHRDGQPAIARGTNANGHVVARSRSTSVDDLRDLGETIAAHAELAAALDAPARHAAGHALHGLDLGRSHVAHATGSGSGAPGRHGHDDECRTGCPGTHGCTTTIARSRVRLCLSLWSRRG